MSSSYNSLIPFTKATLAELAETVGITQFPDAVGWYQVIGGIIVQGGYVDVLSSTVEAVSLYAPYEKQLLGVWLQTEGASHNTAHVANATLSGFEIHNGGGDRSYYWLSLGV